MTDDALFPPSPLERLADLERFVRVELGHREGMLVNAGKTKTPADRRRLEEYWQARCDDARDALEHVSALRAELERIT